MVGGKTLLEWGQVRGKGSEMQRGTRSTERGTKKEWRKEATRNRDFGWQGFLNAEGAKEAQRTEERFGSREGNAEMVFTTKAQRHKEDNWDNEV